MLLRKLANRAQGRKLDEEYIESGDRWRTYHRGSARRSISNLRSEIRDLDDELEISVSKFPLPKKMNPKEADEYLRRFPEIRTDCLRIRNVAVGPPGIKGNYFEPQRFVGERDNKEYRDVWSICRSAFTKYDKKTATLSWIVETN